MKVTWISKRHYTHKDALAERFGRVFEVPFAWSKAGIQSSLELVDYHDREPAETLAGRLKLRSTPIRTPVLLATTLRRIAAERPDVIVASGDCFLGFLAWRLARHIGARFVFDVYDDYRAFGAYRLFCGFDAFGFLLRRASLVFYASRALALQHASSTPWILLPNGVDPATFKSKDRAAARAAVGLPDDGVSLVGYFGGMEAERGPADLVAAVGLLQSAESSVRLVLCGAAVPGQSLEAPWVDYRGSVPHKTIPDYINACDVVALPYRRGPAIDMSSSCKIAEYLYCRRPIVATRTPNLIENFPEQASELGEAMCEPGNPADLARAIHAQLQRPVIASLPHEHSWEDIALRTLETLRGPRTSSDSA